MKCLKMAMKSGNSVVCIIFNMILNGRHPVMEATKRFLTSKLCMKEKNVY